MAGQIAHELGQVPDVAVTDHPRCRGPRPSPRAVVSRRDLPAPIGMRPGVRRAGRSTAEPGADAGPAAPRNGAALITTIKNNSASCGELRGVDSRSFAAPVLNRRVRRSRCTR